MKIEHVRKSSFWLTIKAVLWSFVGLRSKQAFEQDIQHINLLHLILIGLLSIFIFVGILISLVHWMVKVS